jgi:hypothetical protein
MSFVETCLLPVLSTARAAAAPFSDESSDDLEQNVEELGRALAGTARSTLATFLAELDAADQTPGESACSEAIRSITPGSLRKDGD